MRRARSSSDFGINRTTSPIGGSGYPGEHVSTREANIVPSESDSPSVKMRFFAWFSPAFSWRRNPPLWFCRHCERSEAIQLLRRDDESWIASSQVLLAMTFRHDCALSRREAP